MEQTTLIKLNKTLRVLVIIGFIVVAFLTIIYKFDNCNKCEFEYKEINIGAQEFMEIYSSKCFPGSSLNIPGLIINISNITNYSIP